MYALKIIHKPVALVSLPKFLNIDIANFRYTKYYYFFGNIV